MQPPYNKSSCAAENTISNPMGIGFGIDYVTWSNIQKWMLRTPNLHLGHKRKISNPMGIRVGIDYITCRNIPKRIRPTSNLPMG